MSSALAFGLESEVADSADVGSHVRVGPDVFLQHARLLAANTALLTDVLPPSSTSDVHVVFVGLVPERQTRHSNE